MACTHYGINPIRMSYDTVVAQRTSEIYSSIAKQNGVVTEVDAANGIKVQYEDGSTDTFSIGLYYGKGGGEFHKHNKVTDVVVGQKFEQSNILAWDEMFFQRDPFNPGKVVAAFAVMARLGLFEDQFSFEDSVSISKSYAERTAVPLVLPTSFNINDDQVVKVHKKVGDEVEFDTVLFDVLSESADFGDDDGFAGAEKFGVKQIKAGTNGKITQIEVFYNGDIEMFTPACQAFIKQHNKSFAKKAEYQKDYAATGDVGGNTAVSKVEIYPGTIKVNVYIEDIQVSTTADKIVIGNQMKGTIGYIYPYDILTEDGRRVDIIFSTKGNLARMILNAPEKIVVNETNNVYTNRMIEEEEGGSVWAY